MEKNYKLYVHIVPNGKKYYGITKLNIDDRWRKGKGYKNQIFYRAINKYGWDNIEHIVIYDNLTEDEAKELEQYMIQWYDTTNSTYGYNISLGGDGSNHSEETKQKISESLIGHKHSEETKNKISNSHKGKIGKENPKSKSIICLTTRQVFFGARDASRQLNVHCGDISKCCNGKRKSAGKSSTGEKLVWKYIDIIEL